MSSDDEATMQDIINVLEGEFNNPTGENEGGEGAASEPAPQEPENTDEGEAVEPEGDDEGEQAAGHEDEPGEQPEASEQQEQQDTDDEEQTWAQRYANLREHSRTQNEKLNKIEREMQEQREQFEKRMEEEALQRQQQEQQAYAEMQQQAAMEQAAQISREDIDNAVRSGDVMRPLQYLTVHREDLIPDLLQSVRETYGDQAAHQASLEYTNIKQGLMSASLQERINALEANMTAPVVIQNTLNGMVDHLSEQYGGSEAFAPYATALLERVRSDVSNGQQLPRTPDAIYNYLERNVINIMRENVSKEKSKPKGPKKIDTSEFGETKSTKAPTSTNVDNEINGLVAAFNDMKYGDIGPG